MREFGLSRDDAARWFGRTGIVVRGITDAGSRG